MATTQELLSKLPNFLHELYVPGWEPIAFAIDPEDVFLNSCYYCDWRDEPIENIVRVEFWVEYQNQYVYVTKEIGDNHFDCRAMMGEHPGDGTVINKISDMVPFVSKDSDALIHPVLKRYM